MSDTAPERFEDPFAEQRRMRKLLSQETRHLIIQLILGHPTHLVSLAELDYMIPKNEAAILDQLERLREADILDVEQGTEHRNLIDECLWLCTHKFDATSRCSLCDLRIFERNSISNFILNSEDGGWIIRC